MGPLISEKAYQRFIEAVEEAKKNGTIIYGGNNVKLQLNGYYVEGFETLSL